MGPLDDGPAITGSAHELGRDTAARPEPATEDPAAPQLRALASTQGTLDLIVRTACRCLPDIERASIFVFNHDGHVDTGAATSNVPGGTRRSEQGDGAWRSPIDSAARPVQSHDDHRVEPENRAEHGRPEETQAVFRIRVFGDEQDVGLLTMHRSSMSPLGSRARRIAELLADHAALALGRSDRNLDSRTMLVQRRTIGQAVRTLMERYQLDENGAYEYLVRTCQHCSLRLPDLAREVICDGRNHRVGISQSAPGPQRHAHHDQSTLNPVTSGER